jgi:hypothetical protein
MKDLEKNMKRKEPRILRAGHWWFTSIILTWEAEIGQIMAESQPRQIVKDTLSPK